MLSLSTSIFDLILRKLSLWFSHALGQLAHCRLAHSPFLGPRCIDLASVSRRRLNILSLSSSGSFTVLTFQRPQTTWRASDLSEYWETVSWDYPLGSLRLCRLKCSWRRSAKGQQCTPRGCCQFRRLPYNPLPGPDPLKAASEITLKI